MSDRVEFSRVVEHGKVFERIWIVLILLAAAVFRFTGIDWDEYHHYHPDERFITWVAATVEWPRDLSSAFIPSQSSFNPYYWPPDAASKGIQVPQNEPRKFAYGHFPLYAGVAATRLAERLGPLLTDKLPQEWLLTRDLLNGAGLIEFQHLTAVTRALTALVDVGTVWLLFLLGKQVYGVKTGLLAAAFLALNVMHIQLAHFFTFDPYMTFFVVAAIYFMVLAVNAGRETDTAVNGPPRRTVAWYLLLAGSSMGLAVGSKFSAILLILSLTVTVWGGMRRRRLQWLLAAVLAGVLSFLITNPFAALDFSCEVMTPAVNLGPVTLPAFNWKSCFLDNIATQGAMVRGRLDYPFTRQYAGTLPYLYYLEMQMRWGMGPLLGLVAFAGFVWAVWQEAKRLPLGKGKAPIWTMRAWREILHRLLSGRFFLPSSSLIPLILLSWTLPYFLTTGSFYVKFMRYLQPVVPFFMLYGAAMLVTGCKKRWRTAAILTTFTFTSLFALSFVRMYSQPHPWVSASRWIYANIPARSLILNEKWDDSLPSTMQVDGKLRKRTEYSREQLTWLSGTGGRDDESKLEHNLGLLARADYLVLTSNRVYGVVARLPERYPISSQYHQMLFDGRLGYEPVFVVGRTPNLLGFHLKPDNFGWPGLNPPPEVQAYLDAQPGINWGRFDESFTVYDQPLTIIFQNVGRMSAEAMKRQFMLE